MTIYHGRRGAAPSTSPRLFVLQGELPEETFLKEVPCRLASLRARGVFVLAAPGHLTLWLGRATEPHQVAAGKARCRAWARVAPPELGWAVGEAELVEQGGEGAPFWAAVGGGAAELRRLTSDSCERLAATPRCFHMTSVLGAFEVTEVRPDWVNTALTCPLLHSQVSIPTSTHHHIHFFLMKIFVF